MDIFIFGGDISYKTLKILINKKVTDFSYLFKTKIRGISYNGGL